MTELIYQQLLELYIYDLEVELLAEKLRNVRLPEPIQNPYPWTQPNPYVWPKQHDFWYQPPYKVTSTTEEFPYSEKYDARYDPEKNEWLESACGDPDCEYCVNRPEKPLP
jgi:hypothetical protein